VHHRVAEHTKTWGLPFLFLITHMLRKKGIKGNAMDRPITDSPRFSRIQWNQSCSHMPKATVAPQLEPKSEPMDIHEMATEQERAAEPEKVAKHDEQTITLRDADFMLCRTPWKTSDSRLLIYREMHAMTALRPRTCYEPF
jgi:hypothetical protein